MNKPEKQPDGAAKGRSGTQSALGHRPCEVTALLRGLTLTKVKL